MHTNQRGKNHGSQGAKSPVAGALRSASPKIVATTKTPSHHTNHTIRPNKESSTNARKSPMSVNDGDR